MSSTKAGATPALRERFRSQDSWRRRPNSALALLVDGDDIVHGRAGYGIDTVLDGLLYAVIARPPVVGGKLAWHQDYAYWPLATPAAVLPALPLSEYVVVPGASSNQ